jgi:tetratricopeptide (TPR) repeat protein
MGCAVVSRQRGNLPVAEQILRELVDFGTSLGQPHLAAQARFELGNTLGLGERYAESLEYLEACLSDIDDRDREAAIGNIAYTHVALRNYPIARDVFTTLTESSPRHATRIAARISLIEICGALGARDEMESHARVLRETHIPGLLVPDFLTALGRAYTALGCPEAARDCFEQLASVAQQLGMGQSVIAADRAIAELEKSVPPATDPRSPAASGISTTAPATRGAVVVVRT